MKVYRIFTGKIAGMLYEQGFDIVGTEINYKCPQLKVFLFEDTKQFRDALTAITNTIHK